MNNIKDILTISLDEEIKGVIDLSSQDEKEIVSELEGFILTESLAKHLNDFCDEYVSGTMQSGEIYYEKCVLRGDTFITIQIAYPKRYQNDVEGLIAEIAAYRP